MPSDDDNRPTAFPLHNNEPELIDYFASPRGSANQSVLPEWNSNEAERLRATCESRCRSVSAHGFTFPVGDLP